jgi:hypothetical protein
MKYTAETSQWRANAATPARRCDDASLRGGKNPDGL